MNREMGSFIFFPTILMFLISLHLMGYNWKEHVSPSFLLALVIVSIDFAIGAFVFPVIFQI